MVQQLTLNPYDEKPEPAALDRVREQYRHRHSNPEEQKAEKDEQKQEDQVYKPEKAQEQLQDQHQAPAGTELSDAVIEKLEILQRYEARFSGEKNVRSGSNGHVDRNPYKKKGEETTRHQRGTAIVHYLAGAFKRIVQEKLAAEKVLKAATPLEDLGDVEALEAHLQNITHKSQMSMKEIGRLSEELQEVKKAREKESASQSQIIKDLQDQVAEQLQEIERLRKSDMTVDEGARGTMTTSLQESIPALDNEIGTFTSSASLLSHSDSSASMSAPASEKNLNEDLLQPQSNSATKEKKSKGPKMKDQALRELMVRLESVLKEKNQAQEEQEEAMEQMNFLRHELEMETKANKEMAEKMDRLQALVAEMEEREHRVAMVKKSNDGNKEETTDGTCVATETDNEESRVMSVVMSEQLLAVQDNLASSLQREEVTVQAKLEIERTLSELRLTHASLQDSLESTNAELNSANTRVSELQDLAIALGEAKQDLVEALEEVQEKQRLLDLERLWREEAEKNRDSLKREHELSVRSLRSELEEAQRDKQQQRQQMIQDVEQSAADKPKEDASIDVKQLKDAVQELERRHSILQQECTLHLEQITMLSAERDKMVSTVSEQQAAFTVLKTEKDAVTKALSELQRDRQDRDTKIHELESQLCSLNKCQESSENVITDTTTMTQRLDCMAATISESQSKDELLAKMSGLEAEIQALNQVPSKSVLKKLRQELNHTKKAKQEAESTAFLLRAELESTRLSASTSFAPEGEKGIKVKDASKTSIDEELETLKGHISAQEHVIAEKDSVLRALEDRLQEEIARQAGMKSRIQELEVDVEKPTFQGPASDERSQSDTIASITAAATMENDTTGLQELRFLKKERAELSEKLTRLERLHQGFERSSSERIEGLENELALLLQQKAVLEAQVQEQSVLLIKEKEEKAKEKEQEVEVEQARVAEGIERVRLELEAVRTAERFASSKVTELAKDRDHVVEKVIKLEMRLETLKECKVGQEQSLTGRIEELLGEKESLEKQIEVLNADIDQLKKQVATGKKDMRALNERTETLGTERDLARIQISEMESRLSTMETKFGAEHQNSQEADDELSSLNLELLDTTERLHVAQEEIKNQRTMYEDKLAILSSKAESLKTENDSLIQLKLELESQALEASKCVERMEQQLQILGEDSERLLNAKTKAQQDLTEMQGRIKSMELKDRDHKEALALAKDTIHQRDEDLSTTQKLLKQAETKLEKAAEKTTKLEKEIQSHKEKVDITKSSLSKAQQEAKSQISMITTQHSATTQELQKLKATHAKMLQERDRAMEDRDRFVQEKDVSLKELQMSQAELATFKKMQETAEVQMRELQSQLMEARNRVDTLEELTSIAKRVAETKVVEFESLKTRNSELEKELIASRGRMQNEEEKLRELMTNWKANIEKTKEVLGGEISELVATVDQVKKEAETLREKDMQSFDAIKELRTRLEEQEQVMEALQTEALELKNQKRDLVLEMQHFKDLEELLANEKTAHTSAVEDFKMREGHLRAVNKALKEEVRKQQKHLPNSPLPSPSTPYSPYSQGSGNSQSSAVSSNKQQASFNTPATPKPKSLASSVNGGRAFSTPALNLTPPGTPRFNRRSLPQDDDEEHDVNVEYLKNVLLNFMEHKERRQQLIPVVAQMLRLSSEETERFSKV
ncbi:hypothetical protein BGX28_000341 [Mortierella sp. GBA30]|nr:hypothetical protein BGX28_000341 [Mortierella sp. GBA30]